MTGPGLPYKLACLCDLRDESGRLLLIHRERSPNKGLVSPIGGKLDMETGESPAQCAQREIMEEAGIEVPIERLKLGGLISEAAFENKTHWLIFYYRVLGTVEVTRERIPEGDLRWHDPAELETLPVPESDRLAIWPAVRAHAGDDPDGHGLGFFAVHIDCSAIAAGGSLTWSIEQSSVGWRG